MQQQAFYDGNSFDAYTYFGAHPLPEGGVEFRVYAPQSKGVDLWGDFSNWKPLRMIDRLGGIYTLTVPEAKPGQFYKYRIFDQQNRGVDHCDPYGFGSDLRPEWASRIVDLSRVPAETLDWGPDTANHYNRPLNIYELHFGSWRTNPDDPNGWYNYRELAKPLIDYVKAHGYTHIEMMPLAEYPADESWGYQSSGFFAPTSRYGTADDLKELIRTLHEAGIGVLLDYVPIHFVTNDYALGRFGGTALYEYPEDEIGYSEWGSHNFNFYRGEVRSFLKSAAAFWLREFHFDGLRMDAIRNAIFWQGNEHRGTNQGAIAFLQELNQGLKKEFPQCLLIAEDSSDYNKVTAPVQYGGLGFDYKWDMGWMNDTLKFFEVAPWDRAKDYHKITFSMMYFYKELYLLPFSHDEVVHGKKTILDKIYGTYEEKFPQARALYTYMMTHPGKKLNFMGNEIGQIREWDEKREQDWFLLQYPNHDSFLRFITDLNQCYLKSPALYSGDYNSACFLWLTVDAVADCVYIYQRENGGERMVTVLNFSGVAYKDYAFGLDNAQELTEVLNSDWEIYGGNTPSGKPRTYTPEDKPYKQFKQCVTMDLPAFSGMIFRVTPIPEKEANPPAAKPGTTPKKKKAPRKTARRTAAKTRGRKPAAKKPPKSF